MPILDASDYRAPRWLTNPHLNTAWAGLARRSRDPGFARERLELDDGDFLDLDWIRTGRSRLAVLSHGLEGNSRRAYMTGMAGALFAQGWDVLAWNYRGCSGEPNRLLRSYHSGATEDLDTVIRHAGSGYGSVALVGFSLGGNLTLKYLAERGSSAQGAIAGAVVFSVPCDLAASSRQLATPGNRHYMRRFLRTMRSKVRLKDTLFPGAMDLTGIDEMTTFRQFDDRFTAPIHGFADAGDYWARCSARPLIPDIRVPTLMVNAGDDPFLPEECYPVPECRDSDRVWLEIPSHGGHVGFVTMNTSRRYWSERRAAGFLGDHAG